MRQKYQLILGSLLLITIGGLILSLQSGENQNKKSDFFSFFSKDPEIKTVSLIAGGDIMLSRGIGRRAKKEGYDRTFANDGFHPLKQFSSYLSGDALLVFNLESPFSKQDNDKPKGGFLFRANSGNIQILKDIQGNNQLLLSLANNHTNNAGGAGIQFTRALLNQHQIGHFGAGNSTGEAEHLLKIEKNGLLLCFQSYSYDGTYNRYGGVPLSRNPLDKQLITSHLQEMQKQNCDFKILSLHRGREYHLKANKEQRNLAHHLIDHGADLIIGNHSHIPGEREIYNGKVILYSLGNFLFDQDRGKKAQQGNFDYIRDHKLNRRTVPTYIPLLAEIQLSKSNTGTQISLPHFKSAQITKGKFEPLDPQTFNNILEQISPQK